MGKGLRVVCGWVTEHEKGEILLHLTTVEGGHVTLIAPDPKFNLEGIQAMVEAHEKKLARKARAAAKPGKKKAKRATKKPRAKTPTKERRKGLLSAKEILARAKQTFVQEVIHPSPEQSAKIWRQTQRDRRRLQGRSNPNVWNTRIR